MIIYVSGIDQTYFDLLLEAKYYNIMYSYHNIKYKFNYEIHRDTLLKFNLLLDSGAFSVTKNKPLNVEEYASFLKEYGEDFVGYFNLDVIDNGEQTLKNQIFLENQELSPIPVYQVNSKTDYLKYYLENGYEYIGLGGLVGEPIADVRYFFDSLPKDRKYHVFGRCAKRLFNKRKYRFIYSLDCSSWVTAARFKDQLTLQGRRRLKNSTKKQIMVKNLEYFKEYESILNKTYLVSCVKTKRDGLWPAKKLYSSVWFDKVLQYIGIGEFYVLSAKHGLVYKNDIIRSYDKTLKGVEDRKLWSRKVFEQIKDEIPLSQEIVILAGRRYREFLVDKLINHGYTVSVPLEGLGIGQQLKWLNERI